MNFGKALEALKEGKKVKRSGWNGKTQPVELVKNVRFKTFYGRDVKCSHDAAGDGVLAFFGTSGIQMWCASQSDILAEDWCITD